MTLDFNFCLNLGFNKSSFSVLSLLIFITLIYVHKLIYLQLKCRSQGNLSWYGMAHKRLVNEWSPASYMENIIPLHFIHEVENWNLDVSYI